MAASISAVPNKMNNTILKKCLEELEKESPRLDYIRGMIETLIELSVAGKAATRTLDHEAKEFFDKGFTAPTDEQSLLDAKARAAIATVKAISAESTNEA